MPTAAKLFSGICLAVLGYIVSEILKTQLPSGTAFGRFSEINSVIGFICGWLVLGSRAGRGFAAGISNGFTGVVALTFWGLFVQSVYKMVQESMKHRYDGVVEAIAAVFEIGVKLGEHLINAPVILTLLVGAIASGMISETVSRHWR